MSRTYWADKKDGSWEFLGVFKDGHQVKDPKAPQGSGHILDVTDRDVQGFLDSLNGRVMLAGLPSAISKRLVARMPTPITWAQLEGFVK
jgi:hypothetical protein